VNVDKQKVNDDRARKWIRHLTPDVDAFAQRTAHQVGMDERGVARLIGLALEDSGLDGRTLCDQVAVTLLTLVNEGIRIRHKGRAIAQVDQLEIGSKHIVPILRPGFGNTSLEDGLDCFADRELGAFDEVREMGLDEGPGAPALGRGIDIGDRVGALAWRNSTSLTTRPMQAVSTGWPSARAWPCGVSALASRIRSRVPIMALRASNSFSRPTS